MASVYVASDAGAYEGSMGRWSRRLAVPFADFADLGRAARLLDVGCGTGALIAAQPSARAVVGIDVGEAFLRAARVAHREAGFVRADAARLPFPAGAFDAAASLLVLSFLPDPDRAIAEMKRVTRPGGTIAASVWDFRGGLVFMRLLADTAAALFASGEAFRAQHFASPLAEHGGLAAAFARHGLRDIDEACLTIRTDFASFDDLWSPWLAGQGVNGAFVVSLPPDERALLEDALRRAYLAGGADGPRSFAACAWAARARA
jgi:SAM-dependent methyltransferase